MSSLFTKNHKDLAVSFNTIELTIRTFIIHICYEYYMSKLTWSTLKKIKIIFDVIEWGLADDCLDQHTKYSSYEFFAI